MNNDECISIEMCQPLSQTVAYAKRVMITGDSEESKQARLALALNRVILNQLSTAVSSFACFSVSMGIKAESWCRTTSIEYEPDCIFVKKDAAAMPASVFGAVVVVEVAWNNRPFLDKPAVIDPGLLFQELESYIMMDFLTPRLVVFRRSTKWQPEIYEKHQLPRHIDGLDFEIDWMRAYSDAGVVVPRFNYLRRGARSFTRWFRSTPERS